MKISSILNLSRTQCKIDGGSKKRTLEDIATLIAADFPAVDADDLFRRLIGRERLGSTAIGMGVAIPHCRIQNCSGTIGAFFSLAEPVDFEAPDDQPVDIIFALLVPDEARDEHLNILATLAKGFSEQDNREKIRTARSDAKLFELASTLFDSP